MVFSVKFVVSGKSGFFEKIKIFGEFWEFKRKVLNFWEIFVGIWNFGINVKFLKKSGIFDKM